MQRTSIRAPSLPARHSRGFTLVELLVVIAIIGILAALLVVGATAAMNAARRVRIKTEINELDLGIEQYKNEVSGGDYPPNLVTSGSMKMLTGTATVAQLQGQVQNDVIRHFKKVSPRMRGEETLIRSLAGANFPNATIYNGASLSTGTVLEGGLTPAEALVFYLNGFSSDPKAPLTGSGGPVYIMQDSNDKNGGAEGRKPVFPFETTRLGPRDDNDNFTGRYIEFPGPNNTVYRLNLWQYYPSGSPEPIVYFDTSRPILDVEPLVGPHVHAVKQATAGSTTVNRYANDGKFQIMHCGLDEKWGDFDQMSIIPARPPALPMLLFPKGPFTLDLADTITNFTTGTLEDAQP